MSLRPLDPADAGGALPAVLLGGMLGGAARIGLMIAFPAATAVLVANLAGAFALGVLFERLAEHRLGRTSTWAFWGPGCLGAFTTFSALALIAVEGGVARGGLYLLASLGLGVPLAALGRRVGKVGA